MPRNQVLQQIKHAIRNPYAWPGGYPVYVVMADGELICAQCARAEYKQIARATLQGYSDGWKAAGAEVLWENDVQCCHCNKALPSAYGNTETEQPNPIIPQLAETFGAEWSTLAADDQRNVLADYTDAAREDSIGPREYRRRIGAGNLASYARCIRNNYKGA
jgi:hypothetical protein